MSCKEKEVSLESQISDKNQVSKSPVNIFSVRNVAIGLTVFVILVSCSFTFSFKDQLFGWSKSVKTKTSAKDIRESDLPSANGPVLLVKDKRKEKENKENNKSIQENENNREENVPNAEAISESVDTSISSNEDVEGENTNNENLPLSGKILYRKSKSFTISSDIDYVLMKSKKIKTLYGGYGGYFLIHNEKESSVSFDRKKVVAIKKDKDKNEIYIRSFLNSQKEIMVVENENLDKTLIPSFSPDDSKIIYAIKNENVTQIYRIDAKKNPENPNLIQEFDEDSKLIRFKYTIDGKFIVALFSKNENFIFRFIDLNGNEEPKPFKDFACENFIFGNDVPFNFINFSINNFSISKDNSKIVFILTQLDPEFNRIYVINFEETTDNFTTKKIYETKNELFEEFSLHWSLDYKNIVLSEGCGNWGDVIKIISIDSVNEVYELTDENKRSIRGYALAWLSE